MIIKIKASDEQSSDLDTFNISLEVHRTEDEDILQRLLEIVDVLKTLPNTTVIG